MGIKLTQMLESEMEELIQNHEERLKRIEELLFSTSKTNKPLLDTTTNYKGIAGGIRFLLNKNFFSSPKSVKEVQEELKRESYYHSTKSIDKALRIDFTKTHKTLTRLKDGKVWNYVLRK